MPKKLFLSITLLLYSTFFLGQSKQPDIAFDSDYFNAVDHWVVLPKKPTETSYLLGYIYLDAASGFTFVFDSFLTIGSEDSWSSFSTLKNFIFKTILNKNAPLVAIIADDKIKELQLLEKPQWLKRYDSDNTPDVLVGKGSQYNAIGKSDLALPFLEK